MTSMGEELKVVVPEGFKLYTENSAHILLPAPSSSSTSAFSLSPSTGKSSPSKQTNSRNKGNKHDAKNSGSKTAQKDQNDEAFLNPVQEFNRDLSVACIRVWSEGVDRGREGRWRGKMEKAAAAVGKVGKGGKGGGNAKGRKKMRVEEEGGEVKEAAVSETKAEDGMDVDADGAEVQAEVVVEEPKDAPVPTESVPAEGPTEDLKETEETAANVPKYKSYKFTILEALSATGLRSIRYAKEIPLVKYVIANDLSNLAVEAIKRNVELNGLGPKFASEPSTEAQEKPTEGDAATTGSIPTETKKPQTAHQTLGKVRVNEGDACALMYSHRPSNLRVDCVDLDPYGTAAPFIDAAVQCIADDGLLCVTCTDLSVLATNNYTEKCFSNYGGIPVKGEYCHEAALRLVLHTVSSSAGRYGRYIQPLLSLSIDFYVRLFIRIQSAPIEVKKAASKTSMFYICSNCQSFYEQPLGRIVEKTSEKSGQVNMMFKQRQGPPVGDRCPECDSVLHIAGPMWAGPIHDVEFTSKALEHVEANMGSYGTATRMKGMLTVAKDELPTPFYFTPSRVASFFHCISPGLDDVASALLHAGHPVSRSHALAGSLKTTAPREVVHDIFRCWIKEHPVKAESIAANSPSQRLHAKEPKFEANFDYHPDCKTQSFGVKLVRYQQNPTPNWGPGTKAPSKRKRDDDA